ncbi:MAG: S26 family signal peptidase [Pirellulales bacterium]
MLRVVRRGMIAAVAAGVMITLLPPWRLRVEGLSMLPGLQPGSVVRIGWRERLAAWWGALHRYDRWVVRAPDGGLAVKRLAGLPGERVGIRDGDLLVDGEPLLTPPPVLSELASAVPASATRGGDAHVRLAATATVYDDCPQAVGERRLLLPVVDGGAWGVVCGGRGESRWWVRASLGGRSVTWRLHRGGTVAVVCGRLDGRFVAAAWPVGGTPPHRPDGAWAWPAGIPAAWPVNLAWESTVAADPFTATLATGGATGGAVLDCGLWRDLLHRPPAGGGTEWTIDHAAVWVLGDNPAASRDCRSWGAIGRRLLVAPIAVE